MRKGDEELLRVVASLYLFEEDTIIVDVNGELLSVQSSLFLSAVDGVVDDDVIESGQSL